jgi:predicted glycoside hydrolase/deacetylase ChbG (UPF0249 family)
MQPNPLLKKLGFSDHDRVVIIHTDDIGMCQASISAFEDLFDFGLISSAAMMTPCAWFPGIAEYCRQHPEVDMGVHLTLNSEWDGYRWAPISTRDPGSGLLDDEGYFHRGLPEVHRQADPAAVQTEIYAQLERALGAGIDVTHIDTHMGTVAHPKFIPGYVQLATEYRLPPMILRKDQAGYQEIGLDAQTAEFAAQFVMQLEEQGLPLLDHLSGLELDKPQDRIEQAIAALESAPPGLTHFIIHPSKDTPELRAITPDWPSRVADYQAFSSDQLRDFVKKSGIQVIGYRPIRELMRSN